MPVRNALYDAINYAAQVEAAAKKHRREHDTGTRGEFLSGFKKTDRLIPVINLTIYWNDGAWDAPRCLREMMELPDPVCQLPIT